MPLREEWRPQVRVRGRTHELAWHGAVQICPNRRWCNPDPRCRSWDARGPSYFPQLSIRYPAYSGNRIHPACAPACTKALEVRLLRSSAFGVTGGALLIITGVVFLTKAEGKFQEVFAIYHIVFGGIGLLSSVMVRESWLKAMLGQLSAGIAPFAVGAVRPPHQLYGPFGTDLWEIRVVAATLLIVGGAIAFLRREKLPRDGGDSRTLFDSTKQPM